MIRALLPTCNQRHLVTNTVTDDIERRPFGHALSTPQGFQSSVELLVHKAVHIHAAGGLNHALPDTPSAPSMDDRVTLMTGAMAVGRSFAASLSLAISKNNTLRLLVPHAYAVPKEVDSLQDDFDGNVAVFPGGVYVMFKRGRTESETVRRALGSMIGCYSVAWLFDDADVLTSPVIAIVPIFDGDGFAIMSSSKLVVRELLPDLSLPILH